MLQWKIPGTPLQQTVESVFRIKVIRLEPSGFFRVRFFFNNINKHLTEPDYVARDLVEGVGPMVDFVDNFPPQLIFYPEDKTTFIEEAELSLNWHRDAVSFILDKYNPDVFINDIYTPNQMLTSRWWMGFVDPLSEQYGDISEIERENIWNEVYWLYRKLDDIVGMLLRKADENTYVVLTSDHGAVPLNREVRVNNLLAREGLLKFAIDSDTGEPVIDWKNTRAVYLKMFSVYVNPKGLAGTWTRASGPEYKKLRRRVREILVHLEDENGVRPVVKVLDWESAGELKLHKNRSGDLIIANRTGYGWSEEMTADLEVFSKPQKTGYKQAILASGEVGMWTPFMIVGPGVKKGFFLGNTPIEMVDQYPTLMHLMDVERPRFVQGAVLTEVLEQERVSQ